MSDLQRSERHSVSEARWHRTEAQEEAHQAGMLAARARAEWELGDASWAGIIVGAYLHPDEDAAALRVEREDDPAGPAGVGP